jgi:hypothetical protein
MHIYIIINIPIYPHHCPTKNLFCFNPKNQLLQLRQALVAVISGSMSFQLDGATVPWPREGGHFGGVCHRKSGTNCTKNGDILGMSETRLGFGHRGISATKNGNMGIWV